MSFSFSFSGDDIEDEAADPQNQDGNLLAGKLQDTTIGDDSSQAAQTLIAPRRHTLRELLEILPSQVAYGFVDVPVPSGRGVSREGEGRSVLRVPRRALFDIRQQLMVEDDDGGDGTVQTGTASLLEGLATGDLSTGVYEGGFKTWECAVDLAGFVAAEGVDGGETVHVVEMGAGSAVPSLVVLAERMRQQETVGRVRFTLCDYNEDVLRLCTAVNVFLTVALEVLGLGEQEVDADMEGDLEVSETMVQDVLGKLQDANIEVDFISGAWGTEFLTLLRQDGNGRTELDGKVLILASETIYSPASLPVFTRTLLDILSQGYNQGKALVAAKKVYFGVGGGVAEFETELQSQKGSARPVLDVEAGVGRVVLDVKSL